MSGKQTPPDETPEPDVPVTVPGDDATVDATDDAAVDAAETDDVADDVAADLASGEDPAPRPPEPAAPIEDRYGVEDDFTEAGAAAEPGRRPVEGVAAWRRLFAMSRPRATRANLLGALLAVLLGAGIAAQVQLTNERGLDQLSQTDLVRVLDDISVKSSRLDQQVRELEATRDRLQSGTGTAAEALAQAQKRVDTLGILAGTIGAKGQGIVLTITDPDKQVTGPVVLDIIQELRDAGAESIDVGGVRVVASSFVGDAGGDLLIDGKAITRPIEIKAIGDAKTLSSAMTIPGGIVETVRQKGANATVTESQSIQITSVHEPRPMTHAKPTQ
jgi:uncharacterized protein YlxW (UPF0749 family)